MDSTAICLNGELKPGDLVISTPENDYPCLVGTVLSIGKLGNSALSGTSKDYVFVNFMHPEYSPNRLGEIEKMLGDAYGRPTTPGIWPLDIDNLPMSPDSLLRITDISPTLQKAILDSEQGAEALCRLILDGPAVSRSIQPLEPSQQVSEKLYSPLKFFLRDKEDAEAGVYDEIDYWRDELSHEEAFAYIDNIEAALSRDRQSYDTGRGLVEYVPDSLDDVIVSLYPHIELHGDKLWCVADIKASRPITPGEMGELHQWWEGQLSDGWGEGFEQHEIKVDRGDLYVEPWSSDNDFFIDTQQEFTKRLGLETPAQAALHEPDIYDDDATAALRKTLIRRLDDNFTAYVDSLRDQDTETLAGTTSEIAAMAGAHYYMSEIHNFHTSELEYLLQFQNPLQVVGDAFQISGMDDYSDVMWEIFDRQDALRGDYPLVADMADEAELQKVLFNKLDKNLSDYCESLMDTDKREIIGMAEDIAARYAAREYLKTDHTFQAGEAEALLRFEDPLEFVADRWPNTLSGLVDLRDVMSDILEDAGSHVHSAPAMPASPAAKESAAEKRSILEQLREAAKAPKEPHIPKPSRNQSGPER